MTEAPVLTSAAMPIVRIAVLADSRLTEIAVPAELPLREILPAVQRLVAPDAGDDTEPTVGAATRLSLAPVGGAPFSLDASLDTVGVVDGDLLALRPVPVGPAAPGIVEDIADAAVIFSASRRKPWGATHIRRAALAAGVALMVAATGLATAHRALTGEPAGLFAVAAIALVSVLAALATRARSADAALTLAIAALVPVAAAGTLAVPGLFSPAHVVLGAAAVSAWSLICLILPPGGERGIAFFTAAMVAGVGVLAAAAVKSFWELPPLSLGCGLITASLLLTVAAPQISALWARLPLPVIPAPGDPTPSALPQSVLEDLPRRVRVTDAHQTGFVAGAVLLAVLGSVAIAAVPEGLSGWAWYVVAGIAVASVLRARVWDSAWCKAWLLAQPHLTAVVLLACYAATGRYAAAFGAVLVLAALVAVWAVVALSPTVASPESYSLPVRRLVGFLASGVDATLIPVMAYLVGIFAWVLSR
ncbi:type VII secretion integral membrane protein EccD [Mycolicibacter sinensis]|uniref:Type VII secretion integral membrane protein EccD n=1 Tax=Mycolicibacter sinensis (strain JDM601) TaxID=875328 RepID=A0A1A2NNC7_MYCSD|nr:type VII secretion integral membrane protein EccD [Mycolicibacter sinensis]OBH16584.1 type VII secretion integral membrane protein EccD [Mycolicibacter sinensis]OBI31299.1 type VII secretion integral membrane protein EccD [Mycolicibacter sinensis]